MRAFDWANRHRCRQRPESSNRALESDRIYGHGSERTKRSALGYRVTECLHGPLIHRLWPWLRQQRLYEIEALAIESQDPPTALHSQMPALAIRHRRFAVARTRHKACRR